MAKVFIPWTAFIILFDFLANSMKRNVSMSNVLRNICWSCFSAVSYCMNVALYGVEGRTTASVSFPQNAVGSKSTKSSWNHLCPLKTSSILLELHLETTLAIFYSLTYGLAKQSVYLELISKSDSTYKIFWVESSILHASRGGLKHEESRGIVLLCNAWMFYSCVRSKAIYNKYMKFK